MSRTRSVISCVRTLIPWIAIALSPCVREVAARIGSEPLGAQEDGSGSIRTKV
jgi:hypothetical protein